MSEISVFEPNGTYANRKGAYTVLSISGPRMTVRYADGSEAELNVRVQERIWENIVAEREAAAARAAARPKSGPNVQFFIKTLSVTEESDLMIPGLRQRIAVAPVATPIQRGDRLIYYAVEPQLFFAVATITAMPKTGRAKDYMFGKDPAVEVHIYPIDVDAQIEDPRMAIAVDSMELESLPNHRQKLRTPDQFLSINEDDFELLAELVMEVGEIGEEDEDEDLELEDELEIELDE